MKPPLAPTSRLEKAASYLIDSRVGVVHSVEEVRREAGMPNFFHYAAHASNTRAFTANANFREAGGASTDRRTAWRKAVGEAVERYCSALYDVDELPLSRFDRLDGEALAPSSFALYSPAQYEAESFPWVPFRDDTPVRWSRGVDVLSGSPVWVPAARVYMPYNYYMGTGDSPIDQPISTGLACHESFAQAALAAACEVIERDAVTIVWQAMVACPQIRIETLSDAAFQTVARFEQAGLEVTILNATLDHGVPTMISTLRADAPTLPALVVAGSTAPDPEDAVRKSLEELAHTLRYSAYAAKNLPPLDGEAPGYADVTDQLGHLRLHANHANVEMSCFLFTSQARQDFDELEVGTAPDPDAALNAIAEALACCGERLAIVDLTSADVAAFGLHVVRAVIPGFHPLHMGHSLRSLGGKRLWSVPQLLGAEGITVGAGDNPCPHPYP